jgi:hypothetical protein
VKATSVAFDGADLNPTQTRNRHHPGRVSALREVSTLGDVPTVTLISQKTYKEIIENIDHHLERRPVLQGICYI